MVSKLGGIHFDYRTSASPQAHPCPGQGKTDSADRQAFTAVAGQVVAAAVWRDRLGGVVTSQEAQRQIALENERHQLRLKLLDNEAGSDYPMTPELKARYVVRLAQVEAEITGLSQQ